RTVAWFSLFSYPLTAFEIWKWMLEPEDKYTLGQVIIALSSKENQRHLVSDDGSYRLRSSDGTAQVRRERFRDAVQKFRTLLPVVSYLRYLPTVRGVATCNTLAWMHTRKESDIDLFVIVKEGSVWTSRLLSVTPFMIARARPGERSENPLCFSFFLSDTSLNVQSLSMPEKDPYLTYWAASIIPLFDRDGAFDEFQKANSWMREVLPTAHSQTPHPDRSIEPSGVTRRVPFIFEKISRKLQHRRFPQVITQMANRDSRVVISDAMLKFHSNDRRELFRERHESLCEQLGL
ncbi:MAG: hypothetical protein O2877_00420, partial [bacterium]|nr:hypothetical protein [bacterium]